ncbi:MAG: AFG1/ZapE family ATPase [Bacillota bacterium]|jgi:DNA replication protein DnaC
MEKIQPQKFWLKDNDHTNKSPYQEEYQCSICHDTGWVVVNDQATACDCQKEKMTAKRKARAGLSKALLDKTFANFKLDYYPEYLLVDQGISYQALAQKAVKAAQDFTIAQIKGYPSRGLFFDGEVGRGKTFLAAAIANKLIENGVDTLFLVVPEFLEQLRYTFEKGSSDSESMLMDRACNVSVLILDDLGAHNFSDWTKSKIFTLINYRLNHKLPCVITSNLSVGQLGEEIGVRTVSRIMEMCDVYRLCRDGDLRMNAQGTG